MKARCLNPKVDSFKRYGAKGVKVCQKWIDSFQAFSDDVGERPSKLHQLDRIDNSIGYEPGNVRWATAKEQQRNKSSNVLLTHGGETKVLTAWAEQVGMSPSTLIGRVQRGWSADRAITTPVQKQFSRV